MVEKEEASCGDMSTVLVDHAFETAPTTTVGAAIDLLEAKLADKGIIFQTPVGTHKSDKEKVAGQLLRLPMLIQLAITHAIDTTENATENSVGDRAPHSALVPGNIVALFIHTSTCDGRFLRIINESADYDGGIKRILELPLDWGAERFLVVDAGNGNIAFYSPSFRRFLGCRNGEFTAAGYPIVSVSESPRANESFQVVRSDGSESYTKFRLRCPIEKKTVNDKFSLVQVYGFN